MELTPRPNDPGNEPLIPDFMERDRSYTKEQYLQSPQYQQAPAYSKFLSWVLMLFYPLHKVKPVEEMSADEQEEYRKKFGLLPQELSPQERRRREARGNCVCLFFFLLILVTAVSLLIPLYVLFFS